MNMKKMKEKYENKSIIYYVKEGEKEI